MNDKDWYYQVWVHCGHERGVSAVETYKTEWQARKSADMQNAAVEHDERPDRPPSRFYFVQPITAEDLREEVRNRLRNYDKENLERFMKTYKGEWLPYAQRMVESMIRSIEELDSGRSFRLHNNGGWHVGYEENYGSGYRIWFIAIYSGIGLVRLEVSFIRGKDRNSSFVKMFKDEKDLLEWLRCSDEAVKICETKLIDIRCDPELFDDIPI